MKSDELESMPLEPLYRGVWVKCSDEMPTEIGTYNTIRDDGKKERWQYTASGWVVTGITHWEKLFSEPPLPQLPKNKPLSFERWWHGPDGFSSTSPDSLNAASSAWHAALASREKGKG